MVAGKWGGGPAPPRAHGGHRAGQGQGASPERTRHGTSVPCGSCPPASMLLFKVFLYQVWLLSPRAPSSAQLQGPGGCPAHACPVMPSSLHSPPSPMSSAPQCGVFLGSRAGRGHLLQSSASGQVQGRALPNSGIRKFLLTPNLGFRATSLHGSLHPEPQARGHFL